MTESSVDLSIIIPTYREGPSFGDRLIELADWLDRHDYGHVEVVVMMQSDDDSGDREAAQADVGRFRSLRIINLGKRAGKGGAVRAGMFEATGRYRLFMDADLATPLKHLDDVHQLMQRHGQIGIAVRDLWTIHKGFFRKLISKSGNIAAQILVTPGIKDTQCGFKVFESSVAEELFSRQTILGWSFDVEILAIARKLHYKIETFETPDWKDPKAPGMGLVGDSAASAGLNGLIELFKIRYGLIVGRYNHRSYRYEATSRSN